MIAASVAHFFRADVQRDNLHCEASGALIHTVALQNCVSRLQVTTTIALVNELIQRCGRQGMRSHGTAATWGGIVRTQCKKKAADARACALMRQPL
jgi:hypothetical protein